MCGIIAVVRRASERQPPTPEEIRALVVEGAGRLTGDDLDVAGLDGVADDLTSADGLLRGVPGVQCLLAHPDLAAAVDGAVDRLWENVAALEAELDGGRLEGAALEATNAALLRIKDAAW